MKNQEEELKNKIEPQVKNFEKKSKKKRKSQMLEEGDSSDWSLQSLEDLKAINIRDLEQEGQRSETKHKQKAPLQVSFPEKPNVFINAPLHEVGRVNFVVGQLLIVESITGNFVVDLDNWVSDNNKNLVGFVIDVLGRIQNPFYAVKLEESKNINEWIGKTIYYIEGTSKILKDEDIQSLKSKSAAEVQEPVDDSSDEQIQKPQRKYSDDRRERRQLPWNRQRRNRFDERNNEESRDRTRQRQNNRNTSRSRNNNQRYLESMYSMHYNQMMQMYNGPTNNYQPQFGTNQPPLFPTNQPNNASLFGNMPTQSQNSFTNPLIPPPNFSHQNIAQFGSTSQPQQFYGQSHSQNVLPGWKGGPQNQGQPQRK